MALIIEDGSLVTGAQSYVSVAELNAYAMARGITIDGDPEQLLLKAMDYLETLQYIGLKRTRDQGLQWPRANVFIDAYDFPDHEIPQELKNGQIEVALAEDAGNGPMQVITPGVKRERFDVFETEYQDNVSNNNIDPSITRALYKLLVGGGAGGTSFRVVRA